MLIARSKSGRDSSPRLFLRGRELPVDSTAGRLSPLLFVLVLDRAKSFSILTEPPNHIAAMHRMRVASAVPSVKLQNESGVQCYCKDLFAILIAGSVESETEHGKGALDWSAFDPREHGNFHPMGP